jgi:DNA-binding CsgD family transcriptional regulator
MRRPLLTALWLAAFRGQEDQAARLVQATIDQAEAAGHGGVASWAHCAAAVLHNGLGRYPQALAAARQATEHRDFFGSVWALPELIESAARTGEAGLASAALDRLAQWTRPAGSDWGLGIEARSRALLCAGEEADCLYQEAITRLGRTRLRPELARARLLYGEWLRRQQRPAAARAQLRDACQLLEATGMQAFAGRARRELRAAGGTARKRAVAPATGLTAQEAQIARLAADGLSNPEIATCLFLSARTVQYHLGKVFPKLNVTSRNQLSRALASQ